MSDDAASQRLYGRVDALGIAPSPAVPYPAHRTVEDGKALRGAMAGTFTKNLLLKDKKGRLFLLVAHEDRDIDLRTLHLRLGANGRIGFASPEQMRAILGIEPGALTPLGIINDSDGLVTVAIDAALMTAEQLNFHPLVQTLSIGLRPAEVAAFVASCGRKALIVDLSADASDP
jgi:Ala-tRNA(Pro) deacylase